MSATPTSRPSPIAALMMSIAGLAAFAAVWVLVALGGDRGPAGIDLAWAERMRAVRGGAGTAIARAFDFIGGPVTGVVIPALIGVLLLLRRRWWAVAYLIVATTAGSLIVRAVKHIVARARPDDILVTADFGSFPSGHSANAAVTVTIIALLLPRRRWIPYAGAIYVLLMMLSRTYLSAHWLTDTVAGALLGSSVALLVWAIAAGRITAERRTRETHPAQTPTVTGPGLRGAPGASGIGGAPLRGSDRGPERDG